MNYPEDLHWNDLISPTMTPTDFMKKFEDKIFKNYKNYEPKLEILDKIKKSLEKKEEKIKIVALGADWCPDCNRNVPKMIKVVEMMNSKEVEFRILYGIMVDGLHKSGNKIWHKTRSPPEAVNPKFALKKIPTFYFFNKKDKYIGMIQENPQKSIEEDTLEIIERNL